MSRAKEITGLSEEDIVSMVGRFGKHSQRSGQVRGEVVLFDDGTGAIRHHFTKKIIARFDYEMQANQKYAYGLSSESAWERY